MFLENDKMEDNIVDDVSALLSKLNSRKSWDREAQKNLDELIALLEKKKYIIFQGHPSRYHLFRIGDSALYDVPEKRRGHLEKFRGKRVRIICVSSGKFYRQLMAKEIKE